MSRLYQRTGSLNVGGVSLDFGSGREIRVTFHVKKTIATQDPNVAEIEIYNLNEKTRKRLDRVEDPTLAKKRLRVTLEAGHAGKHGAVFIGEAVEILSRRTSTEWITKITASSGRGVSRNRVNRAVKKATPMGEVLEQIIGDCISGTVVSAKEAFALLAQGKIVEAGKIAAKGLAYVGDPEKALKQLGDELGFDVVIDDDQLLLVKTNDARQDLAVVMRSGSGLIGSPERVSDDKRPKVNLVRFECILNPLLSLGTPIQLDALISGSFRAEEVEHVGDTHGDMWRTKVEAKEIRALPIPSTSTPSQPETFREPAV